LAQENLMININQNMQLPIGLVIQSCELLLAEENEAAKVNKLTMIQNAATNLHCNINDVIDFVDIKHA
jgi:hypothetical protein